MSQDGFGDAEQRGESPPPRDRFIVSHDGLRLHARDYGDPLSSWTPVMCLPGLTRSHRDFHDLAHHLSGHRHRPRRVVCPNYRGRARSQWDDNVENYNPFIEMGDVYTVMAALGIPRAVIVGASRGGIIGMFMATDRPGCVAGLVLVDIGPVIEPLGLARIKSYVGRIPPPNDWDDAAEILRRLHGSCFPSWHQADWRQFAQLTFRDDDGTPAGDYDPKLSETLAGIEFDRPVPDMWQEFDALVATRLMVVRGENSDLLSQETMSAMAERHPQMDAVTVAGEGHCPLIRGGQLLNRISSFITGLEGGQPPDHAILPRVAETFDLDATSEPPPD